MRYQQDLQVAIRERLRRLLGAHWEDLQHTVSLVRDWIADQPSLAAILATAERTEPDLDFDAWLKNLLDRNLTWSNRTEDGQAILIWKFMNKLCDSAASAELRGLRFAFGQSHMADNAQMLAERVLAPLLDYLSERVGQDSNVLYVLERYVRRVEWFERERLFEEYEAKTSTGEMVYDLDLRRFLFTEGINMPFSQARSASGLSDVLTDLDSDDPLLCEVKLFTGDKRGVSAGVNQVVHYAQDHSKSSAYLVIINLTGRPLQLPSDGPDGVLPRYIDLSGVRTYLIPVRALPQESASKLGKAAPVAFTRENFIEPDPA